MKYRLLGKTGLRVSEASLGTMTFGDEWGWGSAKAEAQRVYETYREAFRIARLSDLLQISGR
jgi:aryl-alcohol dehydrogenase-like predicted oxidoreductase